MTPAEAAAAPTIVVSELTKRFRTGDRSVVALDRLAFAIAGGGITTVVGPDAAGKTTLLRLIAGLLQRDGGSIHVLGRDIAVDATSVQAEIGYMPQRFGLYEDLTVGENLALHADLRQVVGAERRQRFGELLAFTDLAPFTGRLAGQLSGGMKQKLGLACSLLARPRLLLLDEPSVGVDPLSRRQLWRIVERLTDDGMTVLWTTAYLDEAERSRHVLLLHEGRLLDQGPPADFVGRLAGRVLLAQAPPETRRRVQALAMQDAGIIDAAIRGDGVRLLLREGAAPPSAGAIQARSIEPVVSALEDEFVARLAPARRTLPAAPATAAAHPADSEIIAVRDLTRRFGSFVAVDHVNFSVRRGEIFGLLGPNGAGKSTIFRMLCGLLAPSSGAARVAGIDLGRSAAAARARIGYMAQKFSLYGNLTVRQNLAFFARAYGLDRRRRDRRVDWVLDEFDLRAEAESACNDLPLGFKQRLSLGSALMHEPAILFLDEPTSGVDPLTRRAFWLRIAALAEGGVTVLVTSHFMEEAEYCDRLAIIDRGRLAAVATPAALKASVATAALPRPSLEDAFIALIGAGNQAAAA
ncbi:MAG: ABC transporter ATP-binding protein [Alphaproteobacteria bacterium]|nr:ABC transporter ATP-binding protein [Alphaproteobacteria bacterium]